MNDEALSIDHLHLTLAMLKYLCIDHGDIISQILADAYCHFAAHPSVRLSATIMCTNVTSSLNSWIVCLLYYYSVSSCSKSQTTILLTFQVIIYSCLP